MRPAQPTLPRLTIPVADYLSGIEFRLTQIARRTALPPKVEDELTEVILELRLRSHRLKERSLKLLREGKRPCQTTRR